MPARSHRAGIARAPQDIVPDARSDLELTRSSQGPALIGAGPIRRERPPPLPPAAGIEEGAVPRTGHPADSGCCGGCWGGGGLGAYFGRFLKAG